MCSPDETHDAFHCCDTMQSIEVEHVSSKRTVRGLFEMVYLVLSQQVHFKPALAEAVLSRLDGQFVPQVCSLLLEG